MSTPVSTVYYNVQEARAVAVLLPAGAWDVAPIIMPCQGFATVQLYFVYTGGAQAVAPAFQFRIDGADTFNFARWYQMSLYSPLVVVTGADTRSDIQRESIEYGATDANAQYFMYGPALIGEAIEAIRVAAAETGAIATPGTLQINARFA